MIAWKRHRALGTVGMFLLVLFAGWYGGVDYLQRGFIASAMLLCAVIVGIAVYVCPLWEPFPWEKP